MARIRPPKPEGVANAPRYLQKDTIKKEDLAHLLERCRSLTSQDLSQEDTLNYIIETSIQGSDRAKALLYAANLENVLDTTLIRRFCPGRTSDLFKMAGPLGTFSNKILVAYALGVFGNETKRNFDIIRTIRNAFAHCRRPISFKTSAIEELALAINPQVALGGPFKGSKGFPLPIKKDANDKFVEACVIISCNLQFFTLETEPKPLP